MAGVAGPWRALNEEVGKFLAAAAAHAAAPELWCTPERVRAVQVLLNHGAEALADTSPQTTELQAERALYAANLRRLLAVMQWLQGSLTAFADRLEGGCRKVGARRDWFERHL